jgi:hypothetical protein
MLNWITCDNVGIGDRQEISLPILTLGGRSFLSGRNNSAPFAGFKLAQD